MRVYLSAGTRVHVCSLECMGCYGHAPGLLASLSVVWFVSQRCKYDTCNCQNNEDCMCAALSSYARACAAKGVMLWGWRESVCSECFPTD